MPPGVVRAELGAARVVAQAELAELPALLPVKAGPDGLPVERQVEQDESRVVEQAEAGPDELQVVERVEVAQDEPPVGWGDWPAPADEQQHVLRSHAGSGPGQQEASEPVSAGPDSKVVRQPERRVCHGSRSPTVHGWRLPDAPGPVEQAGEPCAAPVRPRDPQPADGLPDHPARRCSSREYCSRWLRYRRKCCE